VAARRSDDGKLWHLELAGPNGATVKLSARGLVNAAGPWVKHFLDQQTHVKTRKRVRLIKGSHIIVPRLHDGDHAFILQNKDNRIVFVIPYEREFSLIGTTDIPAEMGEDPVCTPEETAYLCELAGHYMQKPVTPADVVWTYSGVRPLFDDGDDDPSAVTRDYLSRSTLRTHGAAAVGVRRQDRPTAGSPACAGGSASYPRWATPGPRANVADGDG
jgi:glycerol-3-phosphate dehydrogenase